MGEASDTAAVMAAVRQAILEGAVDETLQQVEQEQVEQQQQREQQLVVAEVAASPIVSMPSPGYSGQHDTAREAFGQVRSNLRLRNMLK